MPNIRDLASARVAPQKFINTAQAEQIFRLHIKMTDIFKKVDGSIENVIRVLRSASSAGIDVKLRDNWINDLSALKNRVDSVEYRIGFIGRIRVGKSLLLNAVLGNREVFPTHGTRACTSTVIEAKYHEKTTYKAAIEFISKVYRCDVANLALLDFVLRVTCDDFITESVLLHLISLYDCRKNGMRERVSISKNSSQQLRRRTIIKTHHNRATLTTRCAIS